MEDVRAYNAAVRDGLTAQQQAQQHGVNIQAAFSMLKRRVPSHLHNATVSGGLPGGLSPRPAQDALAWLQAVLGTDSLQVWKEFMLAIVEAISSPPAESNAAGMNLYSRLVVGTQVTESISSVAAALNSVADGVMGGAFLSTPSTSATAIAAMTSVHEQLCSQEMLAAGVSLLRAMRTFASKERCRGFDAPPRTPLSMVHAVLCGCMASCEHASDPVYLAASTATTPSASQRAAAVASVGFWKPVSGGGQGGGGGAGGMSTETVGKRKLLESLHSSGLLEELCATLTSLPPPLRQPSPAATREVEAEQRLLLASSIICRLIQTVAEAKAKPQLAAAALPLLQGPQLQLLLQVLVRRVAADGGVVPAVAAAAVAAMAGGGGGSTGSGGSGVGVRGLGGCILLDAGTPPPAEPLILVACHSAFVSAAAQAWAYTLRHGKTAAAAADANPTASDGSGSGGSAVPAARQVARMLCGALEGLARMRRGCGGAGLYDAATCSKVDFMVLGELDAVAVLFNWASGAKAAATQRRKARAEWLELAGWLLALAVPGAMAREAGAGGAPHPVALEVVEKWMPEFAEGWNEVPKADHRRCAAGLARTGLLRSLDTSLRQAARSSADGVHQLALEAHLCNDLLPYLIAHMVLQPSVPTAATGPSSAPAAAAATNANALAWDAGRDLGLLLTAAKASRVLAGRACERLQGATAAADGEVDEALLKAMQCLLSTGMLFSMTAEWAFLTPAPAPPAPPTAIAAQSAASAADAAADMGRRREELRAVLVPCVQSYFPDFTQLLIRVTAALRRGYGGGGGDERQDALMKLCYAFAQALTCLRRMLYVLPTAQLLPAQPLRFLAAVGRMLSALPAPPRMGAFPLFPGMPGFSMLSMVLPAVVIRPVMALMHLAAHEGLSERVRAGLLGRAAPAAAAGTGGGGGGGGSTGAGPQEQGDEDLRPLLSAVPRISGSTAVWLEPLALAAAGGGDGAAFRLRAEEWVRRLEREASAEGVEGAVAGPLPSAPVAGGNGGGGAAAGAAALEIQLCGNPVCGEFDGEHEMMASTKRCGGCKAVRYCCVDCQRAHWRAGHKAACQQLGV